MRVIDLTQILSGPYCTMVLADMGAEVIKVEKYPHGDDTRFMGPFQNEESYSFMMVNRNKKGIRLNIKTEEGRNVLYKLVETADVFIENFRPGVAEKLGIDYEELKKRNENLIYCSISGYGQTGPYSHKGGYDIMAQGMSGIMSMTGEHGGKPVKVGMAIHDIAAAVTAVYNILLAHIHRLNGGKGQYIDLSLVDAGLAWTVWEAAAYFGAGEVAKPNGSRHRVAAPYQGFKTKDGHILVGAANQKLWELFCKHVINKEEWIEDPRFLSNKGRQENIEVLEKLIEDILVLAESEHWLKKMEDVGIPCGPIFNYDEVMNNSHILHREMVREYEHPVAGMIKNLGIPAKLSETPGKITSPAPYLGQHTKEVLQQLNIPEEDIRLLKENNII